MGNSLRIASYPSSKVSLKVRVKVKPPGSGTASQPDRRDWKLLRDKALNNVVQPFEHDSRYLRDLLVAVRNLHFDLADLPLPLLKFTKDRELSAHFITGLKLLRATLDVKLHELRKVKRSTFDA